MTQDMDEARMKEMFQKFGNVVSVKLAREAGQTYGRCGFAESQNLKKGST